MSKVLAESMIQKSGTLLARSILYRNNIPAFYCDKNNFTFRHSQRFSYFSSDSYGVQVTRSKIDTVIQWFTYFKP